MAEFTDPDTGQLLDNVQAGDSRAVAVLLERHRNRLRRLLSVRFDPRMASRIDPSDIIQEALTEAAMRIKDYARDRPVSFYPWLRQIAWKHLINAWRRHVEADRRSVSRELELGLSENSRNELARHFMANELTPSEFAIRDELQRRVTAALQRLPQPDRDLLAMRYLEHLSIQEIGEVLGIREAAARQRHVRALKRLQRLLTPEDYLP